MEGKRFIRTIRLENILSFGPDTPVLTLEPLNVLIGANASGKSNVMETLSLLAAAPRDLQAPIRQGGGTRDWLWSGASAPVSATVEVTFESLISPAASRYRLSFAEARHRFELRDEAVESEGPLDPSETQPYIYYHYQEGRPVINVNVKGGTRFTRDLDGDAVRSDQSILSQRRDPDQFPELTHLAGQFDRMRFYREFNLGRRTVPRLPQRADLPQDFLLEDASNLALVLGSLLNQPPVKERILERMKDLYPSIRDVLINPSGGTLQIYFHENDLHQAVPATRLSDGSLRYLCLLSVLCHPEPPTVVCIEEPELGLHPDIIPEVAKLLVDASSRCQLFVTTHSDILVDALSDVPEAVIVCEKSEGATRLRRLDAQQLGPWLEKYRLGDLWTSGKIGGNRW